MVGGAVRPLPATVSMAYANWGECDSKVATAAAQGANVLVWFALNLVYDPAIQGPAIQGGPNLTCVAGVAASLRAKGLPTHHLISVGGWNAPHPSPSVASADKWYAVWDEWNRGAAKAGLPGGFDGIDWDLEGNDNRSSEWNTFKPDALRLVADISTRAKAAGRLVTIVPPQSYLDSTTSEFSLSVVKPARCWHPEFKYAGRSVYAALLAYAPPDTYDLVSLQLYESWSLAACAVYGKREGLASYFDRLVRSMDKGWTVNFATEPSVGLANATVRVPASRLVLGLANGWTHAGKDSKVFFVPPADLSAAWQRLSLKPRGIMFWDIADEGKGTPPLYMAKALNGFLHTRPAEGE